jgi:hypothetical protein
MTPAAISQYLFIVGAITLLLAFIATLAATTLRAIGRRATPTVATPEGLRLAGAGGGGSQTVTLDATIGDPRQPGATADGIGHGRSGRA